MIHSLIQAALQRGSYDEGSLEEEIESILRANAEGLYEVGLSMEEARSLLRANFPLIEGFLRAYMPTSKGAFSTHTGRPGGGGAVLVEEVIDIEESIWSPRLGVKGMVDATMALSLGDASAVEDKKENASPNTRRLRGGRESGDRGGRFTPMEIKTGKPYFLHNA